MPARAYSYSGLPSRFSAECIGGICSIAPTKLLHTRSSAPRSTATSAIDRTTSPSRSPVVVEARLRELGRGAEAERQQSAGERVERAGVARFLGAIEPLGMLERAVA